MKEEIKEKLLREIEDNLISENRTYDERDIKKAIEETSKAKDEEFIKILYKYFGDDKYIDWTAEELYEGIKEDLKENEE